MGNLVNRERRGSGSIPLWLIGTMIVVALLVAVWVRVYWGGCASYRTGMMHLEKDASIRAVTYFDRAIHWYAPFNPWVEKSARRLWEIGQEAEKEGDTKLALIAYRTIRRGFYAARSVYQPGKEWIRRSEAQIDHLVRAESGELPSSQETRDPDVFWSIVVLIGLFGWIGSIFGFVMAQWGPWCQRDTWLRFRTLWIGAFFVFLFLWFIGLYSA